MKGQHNPLNLFEFEKLAKEFLSKGEFDFIAGGATDEITVERTRKIYDSITLRPRVLTDVSKVDTSIKVLGESIRFPLLLAPSGGHGRSHPDGELATARAAGSVGIGMILSVNASYTLDEVAAVSSGPKWFQQYMFEDRGLTKSIAERAKEEGYTALCITVDTKGVQPKRERNIRNKYAINSSPNLPPLEEGFWGNISGDSLYGYGLSDPRADWNYLEWLVSNTTLPVVIKGIMTREDAQLSVEHGARAIIVSNHGGRHLDTTFATIEVLPEIVDVVNNQIEIYLDGGIRRGTDMLKAIALGAKAVLIGRPIFWGLAVGGENGLIRVLEILYDEFIRALIQCGCSDLDNIDLQLVGLRSPLENYLSK